MPDEKPKALKSGVITKPDIARITGDVTVAVTGATGFVGRAIAQELLDRAYKVKLLVRNKRRLAKPFQDHPRAQLIEGDLHDQTALATLCDQANIVIHCAGLTHALKQQDFFTANCDGAANIAHAFANSLTDYKGEHTPKFIHISSLAARQPDISTYAKSKRQSEDVVFQACPDASIILRAPAMYGPHDLATLPFFKLVKRGLAPIPGGRVERRSSILFIDDFVNAVLVAMEHGKIGQLYEVGDQQANGHSWAQIAHACASSLDVKVRLLALPKPLLNLWVIPSSQVMRWMGVAPMVTSEKVEEFFYPDWAAKDNLLCDLLPWAPTLSLEAGFERASQWYKEHNLL